MWQQAAETAELWKQEVVPGAGAPDLLLKSKSSSAPC